METKPARWGAIPTKPQHQINMNNYSIINKYRAEYDNACDDLYFGISFSNWFKHQIAFGSSMTNEEAKLVWHAAFCKVASCE